MCAALGRLYYETQVKNKEFNSKMDVVTKHLEAARLAMLDLKNEYQAQVEVNTIKSDNLEKFYLAVKSVHIDSCFM